MNGGYFAPHKEHNTGRDIDYVPGVRANLSVPDLEPNSQGVMKTINRLVFNGESASVYNDFFGKLKLEDLIQISESIITKDYLSFPEFQNAIATHCGYHGYTTESFFTPDTRRGHKDHLHTKLLLSGDDPSFPLRTQVNYSGVYGNLAYINQGALETSYRPKIYMGNDVAIEDLSSFELFRRGSDGSIISVVRDLSEPLVIDNIELGDVNSDYFIVFKGRDDEKCQISEQVSLKQITNPVALEVFPVNAFGWDQETGIFAHTTSDIGEFSLDDKVKSIEVNGISLPLNVFEWTTFTSLDRDESHFRVSDQISEEITVRVEDLDGNVFEETKNYAKTNPLENVEFREELNQLGEKSISVRFTSSRRARVAIYKTDGEPVYFTQQYLSEGVNPWEYLYINRPPSIPIAEEYNIYEFDIFPRGYYIHTNEGFGASVNY